jgi:hypothetical protein
MDRREEAVATLRAVADELEDGTLDFIVTVVLADSEGRTAAECFATDPRMDLAAFVAVFRKAYLTHIGADT